MQRKINGKNWKAGVWWGLVVVGEAMGAGGNKKDTSYPGALQEKTDSMVLLPEGEWSPPRPVPLWVSTKLSHPGQGTGMSPAYMSSKGAKSNMQQHSVEKEGGETEEGPHKDIHCLTRQWW